MKKLMQSLAILWMSWLIVMPAFAGIVEDVDSLPTSEDYEQAIVVGAESEKVRKMTEQESLGGSRAGRSGSGRSIKSSRSESEVPSEEEEVSVENTPEPEEAPIRNKKSGGLFVVILLVLAVLGGGAFVIKNRSN